MILDVGSGGKPRGDVNCDLYLKNSPHTFSDIEKTTFFVRCDSSHLPFRDNTFSVVRSNHMLEHVFHPFDTIKEFKRVSNKIVYIRIPNSVAFLHQHKEHIFAWDVITFKQFLLKVFPNVKIYSINVSVMRGKLMRHLGILKKPITLFLRKFFPNELIAICNVRAHS